MATARRGPGGRHDRQLARIHDVMDETWDKLEDKWSHFGYTPETIQKRKNTVETCVSELLADMDQEQGSLVIQKEEDLEELKKEMGQLSKELTLDGALVAQTLSKSKGLALLEVEKLLLDVLKDLRKSKEIRMEKYHKINNKVLQLSEEMGDVPFTLEFDGIPSDAQVAKLEQHLTHLQREKQRRQQSLVQFKKSITLLFECVERIPKNELERVISDEYPTPNCSLKVLSMRVLQDMEELEFNLKSQIQVNADDGEKLWEKIRQLWSRLSIEEEIRNAFEKVHRGIPNPVGDKNGLTYKPSALRGLQNELARLEEEKRHNMALFITQVRDELVDLWISKCFMEKVDSRFRHKNYSHLTEFTEEDFISDLYTEELLGKHESEVEYWRSFVDRNKKIIDGILKRGVMFNQYKTLDQKSDDPARLANRGGALLKEEKERKTLEKSIPKLEKELKQLSHKFEEDQDDGFGMRKFMVFGKEIPEMIDADWVIFHEEKDQRKESRKKQPDVPGVAGKTLMTTHLGPSGSRKRPATPSSAQRVLSTPVKRNKLAPPTPGKTISSTPFQSDNVMKKPGQSGNRPTSRIPTGKPPSGSFFKPPNPKTVIQSTARKLLRKSMGHKRKGSNKLSSLASWPSSSSSDPSFASLASEDSRIQPVMEIVSLDFSEIAVTEFARPATRSRNFQTPASSAAKNKLGVSRIPGIDGKRGKEQVNPILDVGVKSPDSTYSDFTVPLMCQSTLNSSAVSNAAQNRRPFTVVPSHHPTNNTVTTPTKSDGGHTFTPAKNAQLEREYF